MVRDLKYVPGSFWRRDDRSGFKVRSYNTQEEWTGLWIRDDMWETRQPQDFVRGSYDDQRVEDPRPTATPAYTGPLLTTLSANAAAKATSLSVVSTAGMVVGDTIAILVGGQLGPDNETQYRTTIATIPTGTTLTIPLPGLSQAASSGALLTDITQSVTVDPALYPPSSGNGPGGIGL